MTPDLWAARRAAERVQDAHARAAAFFLTRLDGDHRAREEARLSEAAGYERRALGREAVAARRAVAS